jgi:hypothetical protein
VRSPQAILYCPYSIIFNIRFDHRGGVRLYRLRHPCNRILKVERRYPTCWISVYSHYTRTLSPDLHDKGAHLHNRHSHRDLWGIITRRKQKIFERAGSIDYCEKNLREIKDRAVSHPEILPELEAKQSLSDLAEWPVVRES